MHCRFFAPYLSQVFFRVSMALLDLSKDHLMSLDLDGTVA